MRLTIWTTETLTDLKTDLVVVNNKVYHMPMSKPGIHPDGLVYIPLFEHGVGHYQIKLSAKCQ